MWRLFCKTGYVALGHVTVMTYDKFENPYPNHLKNKVVCVRLQYTKLDYNPKRIYTDFDGFEPFGRNWAWTRDKMISIWQST